MACRLLHLIPMSCSTPRLRPVVSRSGLPNVEVGGIPYHSPYNPLREAQKFYNAYPVENADVVLHFGWGLGYAGEILRGRIKDSAKVVVFEPDEELFKASLAQMDNHQVLQDARFRFVVGRRVRQFFDEWTLEGCRDNDEFLWLAWPAAVRLDGPALDHLMSRFKVRLRDRAANLLTHFQNGAMYFENVLANFEYQSGADAGLLFGRFTGVPLVIVSAGPSLDRNVRELIGTENRCFILSVDTALRPLLAAGIVPHAVVVADPTELNARHVAGAIPPSTYLIAEQAVHGSAMQAASRRFLFGLGLFPDPLFKKFGFAKSRLEVWGSVATAALDLACRMGANPVIFAGQDFAYSWDRNYSNNTIFDGNPFRPSGEELFAADIWGRQIPTTENLIAYRDFFVRKIRQTSGVRFINATEGGILTEAVEILSLRDALYQCRSSVDVRRVLSDCWRPKPASFAALGHLYEVLETRNAGCECLNGFLDLTAKEHLLKRDEAALNERILWGLKACELLVAR